MVQVIRIKNALQTDIAKVLTDYPNGCKNISGEQVIGDPQMIEFEKTSKKFRTIYNSPQHFSSEINGTNAVFKAEFIKSRESIKFTTIVFDAGYKTPELKKLKVALLLKNEMLESVIKIKYMRSKERIKKEDPPMDD